MTRFVAAAVLASVHAQNHGRRRGVTTTTSSPDPKPESGLLVWHLFEPKYTGLAQKDGADFKGDSAFIFSTFRGADYQKQNPEASLQNNVIEMSEVNVTGWGAYQACNAPGAYGHHVCPANSTDYCCDGEVATSNTFPGREIAKHQDFGPDYGDDGYWYSFPRASMGVTWTERVLRRIHGSCLGNEWRKDAGGCNDCGEDLDACVATCVKAALCPNGSVVPLKATWDRVFNDTDLCPDVAFPEGELIV